MVRQSAHSSKASYGNYSLGSATSGALTRGDNHDDKPRSSPIQGTSSSHATVPAQVGKNFSTLVEEADKALIERCLSTVPSLQTQFPPLVLPKFVGDNPGKRLRSGDLPGEEKTDEPRQKRIKLNFRRVEPDEGSSMSEVLETPCSSINLPVVLPHVYQVSPGVFSVKFHRVPPAAVPEEVRKVIDDEISVKKRVRKGYREPRMKVNGKVKTVSAIARDNIMMIADNIGEPMEIEETVEDEVADILQGMPETLPLTDKDYSFNDIIIVTKLPEIPGFKVLMLNWMSRVVDQTRHLKDGITKAFPTPTMFEFGGFKMAVSIQSLTEPCMFNDTKLFTHFGKIAFKPGDDCTFKLKICYKRNKPLWIHDFKFVQNKWGVAYLYDLKDIMLCHDVEPNPGPPIFSKPLIEELVGLPPLGDATLSTDLSRNPQGEHADGTILFESSRPRLNSDLGDCVKNPDHMSWRVKRKPVVNPEYGHFKREVAFDVSEIRKGLRKLEMKVDSFINREEAKNSSKSNVGTVSSEIDFMSAFIKIAIETADEADSRGMFDKALLIRETVSSLGKYHPQMFGWPKVPSVPVAVDTDTQEWFSTLVSSFADKMSNPTVGIDVLPRVDISSPMVICVGILVLVVGIKLTTDCSFTSLTTGFLAVAGVIIAIKYSGTYIETIYNKIVALLPTGIYEPQSGVKVDLIADLLCSGLFYSLYNSTPKPKLISTAIKTICDFSKMRSGMADGVSTIIQLCRDFVNWCAENVFNSDFHWAPDSGNKQITLIANELNAILRSLRNGGLYDSVNAQKIFTLEARLRDIKANLPTTREYAGEVRAIESLLRDISSVASNFVGFTKGGAKVTPLSILVVGPSGVGKGVNFIPLIHALSARVMTDDQAARYFENPDNEIFNWMTEQEFFEGHHGQFWWLVDEAMQMVDSSANPDPGIFGLIRANNIMPFVLNMANAGAKGNQNACPMGIIGTTNAVRADIKSIKDPEAYTRRWEVQLLQVPKPEFCVKEPKGDEFADNSIWKRRLDRSKVSIENISLDISEFYLYDVSKGCVLSKTPMYFRTGDREDDPDSVVRFLTQKFVENRDKSVGLLNFHKSYLQKQFAKRRTGAFAKYTAQSGKGKTRQEVEDDILSAALADSIVGDFDEYLESQKPEISKVDFSQVEDNFAFEEVHGQPVVFRHLTQTYVDRDEYSDLHVEVAKSYSRALSLNYDKCLKLASGYNMDFRTSLVEFYSLFKTQFLSAALEVASNSCQSLYDFLTSKPVLACLSTALGIAAIFWSLAKPSFLSQSGSTRVVKKFVKSSERPRARVAAQIGKYTQNTQSMVEKVFRNFMYHVEDLNGNVYGYLVFLCQRVGFMPKHFLDASLQEYYEGNHECGFKISRLVGEEEQWSCKIMLKDLVDFNNAEPGKQDYNTQRNFVHFSVDNEDLLFFRIPDIWIPAKKSICHFFLPENSELVKVPFSASLIRINEGEDGKKTHAETGTVCRPVMTDKGSNTDYGYNYTSGFGYNIVTKDGECGAPIFMTDSRNPLPRIVGFHVAGDGLSGGLGVSISRESIDAALEYFGVTESGPFSLEGVPKDQCGIPSKFPIIRQTAVMSSNSKTNISRAPLYGKLGPVMTAPALLSDRGELRPALKVRKKYCIPSELTNAKLWERAGIETGNAILNCDREKEDIEKPFILSFRQAVAGYDTMKGLSMSSSAGYPFGLEGRMRKKKNHFIDKDGDIDFDLKSAVAVEKIVDQKIEEMEQGLQPEFLFADSLKDETRPLEKVRDGSTRLISCEPLDLSIIIRMYFGSFIMACLRNKVYNGIAIGLNPYSYDWTILAKYLGEVGDNKIAGDHSGYDGRYRIVLYFLCLDIVERYYYNSTPDERQVRRMIIEVLVSSLHVANVLTNVGGEVDTKYVWVAWIYEWFGSMPSGVTLTALFDSIGGLIINRYNIYGLLLEDSVGHLGFEDDGELDFAMIERDLRMVQGGDDNVISIGEWLRSMGVNQREMTRFFIIMGWIYTDEAKGSEQHDLRPISDISFYKRGFVWDRTLGRFRAPLEFESIDERVNWISSKAAPGDYARNIRSAVLEYSFHTTEVWETRAKKLINVAKEEMHIHDLPERQRDAMRELMSLEAYI